MPKISTQIARELFLYGPPGGKRITNVKELVRLSGASERAIYAHMPQWKRESEELAASGRESGLALCLRTCDLDNHKSDCEFLRSEVDRLKLYLKTLPVSDETYPTISRAMLTTEKQWAAMSGVLAALDAAACAMKETARLAARAEAANLLNDPPADELEACADVVFKRRG